MWTWQVDTTIRWSYGVSYESPMCVSGLFHLPPARLERLPPLPCLLALQYGDSLCTDTPEPPDALPSNPVPVRHHLVQGTNTRGGAVSMGQGDHQASLAWRAGSPGWANDIGGGARLGLQSPSQL